MHRRRTPIAVLVAAAALAAGATSLRPAAASEANQGIGFLLAGSTVVVRGEVIEQTRAPGGLWHRVRTSEVLWHEREAVPPRVGATHLVFAHGPGVPDSVALSSDGEVVLGLQELPEPRAGEPQFYASLRESFLPASPEDRPWIVGTGGLLGGGSEDPATLDGLRRLIRASRAENVAPGQRAVVFEEIAEHANPRLREASVRRLLLDPAARARIESSARLLDREIDRGENTQVLAAHLDLLESESVNPHAASDAGPPLRRLLRRAKAEQLAARTAELYARVATASEVQLLRAEFPAAEGRGKRRILHVLALRGGDEHLPVFQEALRSRDTAVRGAAILELSEHPSPRANALLELAARDVDPRLRGAARAATAIRREAQLEADAAGEPIPDASQRLGVLLRTARAGAADSKTPSAVDSGGRR